jgi:hypothetical protein
MADQDIRDTAPNQCPSEFGGYTAKGNGEPHDHRCAWDEGHPGHHNCYCDGVEWSNLVWTQTGKVPVQSIKLDGSVVTA